MDFGGKGISGQTKMISVFYFGFYITTRLLICFALLVPNSSRALRTSMHYKLYCQRNTSFLFILVYEHELYSA